jgi:hypothetical protein
MVRKYVGYRQSCEDTPLNQVVNFLQPLGVVQTTTAMCAPAFRDFRIVTVTSLITGSLREKFLRHPFEQMVKLVQPFHFDEPLKYIVSKPNPHSGTVEIQLPLELNHPVTELLWVFRRKAVLINNEWSNFTPAVGYESTPEKVFPPWLSYATLRINGSEVIAENGDWFREHIASKHRGGIVSYHSYVYGYSFSEYPNAHQPSGSANMSRAVSVTLNLRVNQPIEKTISAISPLGPVFDEAEVKGWEVFVYAIYYNWLRFENGICNRMFTN